MSPGGFDEVLGRPDGEKWNTGLVRCRQICGRQNYITKWLLLSHLDLPLRTIEP